MLVDGAGRATVTLRAVMEAADALVEQKRWLAEQEQEASEEANDVIEVTDVANARQGKGVVQQCVNAAPTTPTAAHELPEHLRLGVSLPGMQTLLSQLPPDAVKQANARIPFGKNPMKRKRKFPLNETINGYVNQSFFTKWAQADGLTVCERLQKAGSPHVGKATVFVSWTLSTPIETLLDALGVFLERQGLSRETTHFWVSDYVIRQTDVENDLTWLGDCIQAIGHTVLLMDQWTAPEPLTRAYCIKEIYNTEKGGAILDVMMSTKQQTAFDKALVTDFARLIKAVSSVDVRQVHSRHTSSIPSQPILQPALPFERPTCALAGGVPQGQGQGAYSE